MTISIHPPSSKLITEFSGDFALQQDNWNDFSFRTLYHLYVKSPNDSILHIGGVKILKQGQRKSDGIQLQEPFQRLPHNYCSVGTSLDYYERLNEIPRKQRDEVLSLLRDVVAAPSIIPLFAQEEGWTISLFRDNPHPEHFIADATAILLGDFSKLADIEQAITFEPAGWGASLNLNFDDANPDLYMWERRSKNALPRRIAALIGRNGAGKSTLLARLARVAFASPFDRSKPQLQLLGQLEPRSIGFSRIISISYSAFDNFVVPGVDSRDRRTIATEIDQGMGRYIYVGLRDIAREVRDSKEFDNASDASGDLQRDRQEATSLKSLEQLASEFSSTLKRISNNGDAKLLQQALGPLLADPSFSDYEEGDIDSLIGDGAEAAYLSWSTGHKIVLHVVASLVAHVVRRSLVLFDEPEMHLHPPLIAALMHAVRRILEEKDGMAIVATHSPVVIQETMAHHVRIVRRIGGKYSVESPERETFGENVGTLTYDTFGLTASATDYHKVLDDLVVRHSDLEEIEKHFSLGLSGQALAYVMAGLARKKKVQ